MTHVDEMNLRAGIRALIDTAVKNTSDSRYYIARLTEDICHQIVQAELRKPTFKRHGSEIMSDKPKDTPDSKNADLDYAIYMRDQSAPGTTSFTFWNAEVKRLRDSGATVNTDADE